MERQTLSLFHEQTSATFVQKKTIASVSEINILGYSVGNGVVKPDSERLRPLRDIPAPHNAKLLKRTLGLLCEVV